jgi:hypothetical protein
LAQARFTTPEKALWIAVLEQAFADLGIIQSEQSSKRIEYERWKEASEWIQSDNREFRSALWIMDTVGIESDAILRRVAKFRCPCCRRKLLTRPCASRTKFKKVPNANQSSSHPEVR